MSLLWIKWTIASKIHEFRIDSKNKVKNKFENLLYYGHIDIELIVMVLAVKFFFNGKFNRTVEWKAVTQGQVI